MRRSSRCRDGRETFISIAHLETDLGSPEAQALVKKLQDFITKKMYTCTKDILSSLGQMYAGGGDFTTNIDGAGGEGTAQFASDAIEIYCG